jgi:hypothetical protein
VSPHLALARPHGDLVLGFKLSVGRTCSVYLFEIEGLLTQESRPGQISAAQRGRISDLECSGMIGIGIGRMDVDTTTSIPDP